MRKIMVVSATTLVLVCAAGSGNAKRAVALQQPSISSQPASQSGHPNALDDRSAPDPFKGRMETQNEQARTNERRKKMLADTEKLLRLSTELKEEVDKTTKNEMSIQVIQKAAEIEKLARDVKDRMKGQ